MRNKFKNFNVVSYINEGIENQKTRFLENHYHPYDHISKTRLKEKTNNIR